MQNFKFFQNIIVLLFFASVLSYALCNWSALITAGALTIVFLSSTGIILSPVWTCNRIQRFLYAYLSIFKRPGAILGLSFCAIVLLEILFRWFAIIAGVTMTSLLVLTGIMFLAPDYLRARLEKIKQAILECGNLKAKIRCL